MLVARGDSSEESKSHLASSRLVDANGNIEDDAERSTRSRMNLEKEGFFGVHVVALLKKRAFNFQRDKKAWCCTAILPVIFVTIGFMLVAFTSPERNLSPLILDLSALNPDVESDPVNPIPVNSPDAPFACQPGECLYDPIVAVSETNERYTFCGTQANLGAVLGTNGLQDSSIQPPSNLCTIADSFTIVSTLSGFQQAVPVETDVGTIATVSETIQI